MSWHHWVLRKFAMDASPEEWERILEQLKRIISGKYIDKIEVAAFSIRGERKARWCLKKNHPEYSTKTNALGAAKKLTWLLLKSRNAPAIPSTLKFLIAKNKKFRDKPTFCPVCKKIINFEDFERSGRTDPISIQMGHLIPLSRESKGHNAENVVWVHRRCNYIQDEQTVSETIDILRQILERHGYRVSLRI